MPDDLIPKVAEEILIEPDPARASEMESDQLTATDNGWQPGDPEEQPFNPERVRHG